MDCHINRNIIKIVEVNYKNGNGYIHINSNDMKRIYTREINVSNQWIL